MRCALPSSRVRSAHRLQPFSSDPRRTCVQVPASAEGEAAEAEGVPGAAGAASAAPEQVPAHPPAPERVEQQLEQQEEQQPVPELSRETKPRVMAPFRRVAGLFAGTVMGVNEDGTLKVSFDDGDYDGNVPRAYVRDMTAAEKVKAENAYAARMATMQAVERARALACET